MAIAQHRHQPALAGISRGEATRADCQAGRRRIMTAPTSTASVRRARTVKQFCADYGVGKTLTYAEMKAGRLRAVKVGFRTLILHEDSEAWVRSLPEVTPCQASLTACTSTSRRALPVTCAKRGRGSMASATARAC